MKPELVAQISIEDLNVPSKKNRYQVHFSKEFWSAIRPVVERFRWLRKKTYWIAPPRAVTEAEEIVAWKCKAAIRQKQTGPLRLNVFIRTRADLDNVLGVLCDGLEKSGMIDNDRQIKELHVYNCPETSGVDMVLWRIGDSEVE